jgi:hypothetical protein
MVPVKFLAGGWWNLRGGGSALSGSSSIVPLSQAFQPGGTLLPSLSPA